MLVIIYNLYVLTKLVSLSNGPQGTYNNLEFRNIYGVQSSFTFYREVAAPRSN